MATLAPATPPEGPPASIRSGSAKQWTPEHYSASISTYAKQRSTSLYVGVHFTRLAHILRKPFDGTAKRAPTYNYTPSSDFATLYQYVFEKPVGYHALATPLELVQLAESEASNVLFLRGQPCPQWLVHAGASFHIDPEFFFRHLDFLSNLSSKRYFAQPSLMSTARRIIQLNYMTIGEFPAHSGDMGQSELDHLRDSATRDMSEYFNELGKRVSRNACGSESIVRAYHVLDQSHFAIEQQASICLGLTEKGWTAVVWLDTGRPLTPNQPGPWAGTLRSNQHSGRETFLPWIQSQPFVSLHPASMSIAHERRPVKEMEQSASLIHLDYGKTLDKKAMAQDPFYALHEVFLSCAYSEVQFLNVIESKINEDMAREFMPDHNISPANMIYFQGLLDTHAESLRRTITAINSRDDSGWPRPSDQTLRKKHAVLAHTLLQDYEALLRRTETLSNLCKGRLQILLSRAGIVESNKAIEQAKVVTKLTRLAFVFIPLSFVSSFFGMNLKPFVESPPYGLWLFFAVSAPVVALLLMSMTLSLEQIMQPFGKCGRVRKPSKIVEKEDMA
ncbi:uncharacterized protein K460DRAFT_400964 [Cucurbitaria berberidis CBS 394.84]|uniref:Uncharacterized protein n=1 Tax=Cucurbitaria berberidis CBS 394.84 TaxID=1168544 RepID=A0A9P4GT86_9PLEO|nr:uncharacterized protein K460DRAFT_400964 [Cucurbitaria berberidis CBS 394.84]KAF1850930.1 hypothetical protein K460DRAFT_400964 [Cucurbitaria berberidis CBS 394.84]